VLLRHNDIAAEWHHLCAQALTPAAVSDEPLISRRGTTAIFDVRITDTDARSYRGQDPVKNLQRHEKDKKKRPVSGAS
jgi:hypothetical protein